MSNIKDTVLKAGHTVADKAGDAVQAVATGVNHAAEFVKEKVGLATPDKGVGAIQPKMDVIASCGSKVGVVDDVEGSALKLTRKDSPDGQHHFVSLSNVAKVDEHVHLKMNSKEFREQSKNSAAACGC
ncbi:DUF2171 domain-containing protein [Zavarzinella formosa]|uniref:DUF2171 domain-containing protein n=1 Tax=Zavarzinella formosa TaxID=360055 RepID=UPI00030E9032|nr:DUF2171 domain-containing protein [Zavarzinella formosa]